VSKELFVYWPGNADWLRIRRTNLLFCPKENFSGSYGYQWYIVTKNDHLYLDEIDFNLTKYFTPFFTEGSFITLSSEEVLDLLPASLQTELLFHLDMITKETL